MEGPVTKEYTESPASKVMDEAIELAIAEESPYPERCAFVNAETPHTESQMESAARDGYSVVLVSSAGDIQVIAPEEVVSLTEIDASAAASPARQPGR
jgi:hypothetical protein